MNTTTASKRPTSEQMKAYAEKLPDLYRKILKCLQTIHPDRVEGENLWLSMNSPLWTDFNPAEARLALFALEEAGFLNFQSELNFVEFTENGEDLLAAITGKRAKSIPKLPQPEW